MLSSFKSFAIYLSLLVAVLAESVNANPPLQIRIWEGTKYENVSTDALMAYLSQVLFPTTISANGDSLQAYIPIVLDFDAGLPDDALIENLPFHEAALVVHLNEATYNEARRRNPWYGPLHFLKGGGFEELKSYSAAPIPFAGSVQIASPGNRVGYDFRNPQLTDLVDWQSGQILVSVILRRKGVSEGEYLRIVAEYSEAVRSELADSIDGHLLRAGQGHALEFLRFNTPTEYKRARRILDQISARYNSALIFDFYRKTPKVVPHGAAVARPGAAFSIKFDRPFRCAAAVISAGTK